MKYSRRKDWILSALSPRQRQVWDLLVETPLSYREIGAKLGMNESTAKVHGRACFQIMRVSSRVEAILICQKGRGPRQTRRRAGSRNPQEANTHDEVLLT